MPDAAVFAWQKAVELKPDFAEAHYALGVAYAQKKQFDDAIKEYLKVLEKSQTMRLPITTLV